MLQHVTSAACIFNCSLLLCPTDILQLFYSEELFVSHGNSSSSTADPAANFITNKLSAPATALPEDMCLEWSKLETKKEGDRKTESGE